MSESGTKWVVRESLSQYQGEYVLISDEHVVSHGKELKEMLAEFRSKHPHKTPLVAKVPHGDVLIL